jgi:hypothetical protein
MVEKIYGVPYNWFYKCILDQMKYRVESGFYYDQVYSNEPVSLALITLSKIIEN